MSGQAIDGRPVAQELKSSVTEEVRALNDAGIACGLATVLVGDDYSSHAYAQRLARVAAELGVPYRAVDLTADTDQDTVLAEVAHLNADDTVTGILVLRPLPRHVDEAAVFTALDPRKDIEAVNPENAGLLALGTPRFVPSTAAAAFHLLDRWLDGQGVDRAALYHRAHIVVVGRSNNVGKPAVSLAYQRQASVTTVDEWASRAGLLGWHTRRGDVLLVAAGVPGLIRSEHVREGAIVIDIGINPVTDPDSGAVALVGDVEFDDVLPRAGAVSTVPGGVGPITDVWLLRNVVAAARLAVDGSPSLSGAGAPHLTTL